MATYIILSGFLLVASAVFHLDHIILSPLSMLPLALVALSALQAALFHADTQEHSDLSGLNFTKHEINPVTSRVRMSCHSRAKLLLIPPICVFSIYFSPTWKVIGALLLYALSYLIGYIWSKLSRKEF